MTDTARPGPCSTCVYMGLVPQAPEQRTLRVEELLAKNLPPSEVELAEFRVVVDNSAAIIHDLDERIVEAQGVLDHLVRARAQADSHLADAKTLIHPIRSIPAEILEHIFRRCLPDQRYVYKSWDFFDHSYKSWDSLDHRRPPWTLSHVCRVWRGLVLSLPLLWTTFCLSPASYGHMKARESAYKAALYLSRSEKLPIDVFFSNAVGFEDLPMAGILELSMPRWRTLLIKESSSPLHCFPGTVFSSLTSFSMVYLDSLKPGDVLPTALASPASVPCLRSVDVEFSDLDVVPLPWAQILSLKVCAPIDEDYWNIFGQMSSLEDLTVVFESTTLPIPRLHLPKLASLHLDNCSDAEADFLDLEVVIDFMSVLDAPMLSELSLVWFDDSVDEDLPPFPCIPSESLRQITTLSIDYGNCKAVQSYTAFIIQCLSQTVNVEILRLRLHDGEMTALVTALIMLGSADEDRLPRLRVFDIALKETLYDNDDEGGIDKALLRLMLESRSRYGPPREWDTCLETLIVTRTLYDDEDKDWVSIRSSGLHVECIDE